MTSSDNTEADLRSLCVHECGHVLCSVHIGIPCSPSIDVASEGTIIGGWCAREFRGSAFQAAVVGWGGIAGEHILNAIDRYRTPLPWRLTAQNFEVWHDAALFHIDELSAEDREHILSYWDTGKSCRHAFEILFHDRERLDRLANELIVFAQKLIDERRAQFIQKQAELDRSLATNLDGISRREERVLAEYFARNNGHIETLAPVPTRV